jgi:hypothetical protein
LLRQRIRKDDRKRNLFRGGFLTGPSLYSLDEARNETQKQQPRLKMF